MELHAKRLRMTIKKHFITNAQSDKYDNRHILTFEMFDEDKNLRMKESVFCAGKSQGSNAASIEILKRMLDPTRRWLELVEDTRRMVEEGRVDRGAMEKPVKKKMQDYIAQFEQTQKTT